MLHKPCKRVGDRPSHGWDLLWRGGLASRGIASEWGKSSLPMPEGLLPPLDGEGAPLLALLHDVVLR